MAGETATIELRDENVTGKRRWRADFGDESAFQVEAEGGDLRFTGETLEIDCTENGDGVTVWRRETFPGDVLVEYTATCHEDSEADAPTSGRNLNLFVGAAGDDGDPETLAETDQTGAYNEYHDLPNYIFTLTYRHSRMRRDPGFEKRIEFVVGAQPDHAYDIQVLRRGGEIAAAVDGRLLHHWHDEDPHGGGWVGLRTWNTDVTYEDWAVYEL